ncbi:hypothetical protein V2J94_41275 [Streptomyces sp. DSM 41524]|uniref:Phage protein n=1 Tax=Streptomyces asiaticus subsp. ignotus TaxID=3098222 RepID=A0ABU7Q9X7_9ACTN|nr:hypothetical protein [Streptomyces sp. DSM 41524]
MTTTPRRSGTVPYIATWTGESAIEQHVVLGSLYGIAYADETPADRDERGVLWTRRTSAQGSGQPELGSVHAHRQRRAMEALLCQVCGGPADRDERGTLWLLEDNQSDWAGWPEDALTVHPPVCLPCAREATRRCPHLAGKHVAVRVGATDICAVFGIRYVPTTQGLVQGEPGIVSLASTSVRWTVAGQLVRALNRCTLVDLQTELSNSAPRSAARRWYPGRRPGAPAR